MIKDFKARGAVDKSGNEAFLPSVNQVPKCVCDL